MQLSQIFNLYLVALLSTTYAQVSEDSLGDDGSGDASGDASSGAGTSELEVGQGEGKVANTDTSKYAGTYEFTYYYPKIVGKVADTAQLKCDNSTGFTLDIPGKGGVDVQTDFKNLKNEQDPMYNTKQSSWIVKELATGGAFDTLKIDLFVNDDDQKLICWVVKKQGNDIFVNLNPNKQTSCPTRFIPSPKTCQKDVAFLMGKCKSGACSGDGSKGRTEKSKNKNQKPGQKNDDADDSSAFAVTVPWLAMALSLPIGASLL